jgi:RecB family exonuclease
MGEGEKSRFINQIIYELPLYNKNTKISTEIVSTALNPELLKSNAINIEKTPGHLQILKEIAAKSGFSPSALQIYANCRLRFFFNYIEKLKPEEEPEEEPDARGIGNIIHKVLEDFYKPFLGKILDAKELEKQFLKIGELSEEAFSYVYPAIKPDSGKNLIWLNISRKLSENFVRDEIRRINELKLLNNYITLNAVESSLEADILLNNELNVRIRGKADRIELESGNLRIVDFKTGNVKKDKLDNWENFLLNDEYKVPSQLAVYALLAAKDKRFENYRVSAACANLRKYSYQLKMINYFGQDEPDKDFFKQLNDKLIDFVSVIFNPEENFFQTIDVNYCEYCDFRSICNR